MEKECWKDVKDYEGLYQVSTLGRVKSLPRNTTHGKILKSIVDKDGYLYVNLYNNGYRKKMKIHRLVAQAFIPNPQNKPEVNHIDENKQNNMVENLEWLTSKENSNYGTRNGRISKPILCVETGIVYKSAKECAKLMGIKYPSAITRSAKGTAKTAYGYTFKYKENI